MTTARLTRSYKMHLSAPPEVVFPLLCPVREYEWIETWACDLVFTESGIAELDGVFKTSFSTDGPEDTWVISRYDPPTRIEFVRINSLRTMRYAIGLASDGARGTLAEWTQVITALGEDGNRWLSDQSEEAFAAKMSGLERMLDHFLATGKRLSLTPA